MRRTISLLLASVVFFSFAACQSKPKDTKQSQTTTATITVRENPTDTVKATLTVDNNANE